MKILNIDYVSVCCKHNKKLAILFKIYTTKKYKRNITFTVNCTYTTLVSFFYWLISAPDIYNIYDYNI